jgi:hypothetical protein
VLPRSNLGDILAIAIAHGIGAGLAVAGTAYLIVASTRGPARHIDPDSALTIKSKSLAMHPR